jgi:hypothetical protein
MVLLDPKAVQRTGASFRKLSSALSANDARARAYMDGAAPD